ncbi:right-handed parallel beta-helix repeat-containing protein [Streptomyces sp. NPDC087270]|uniref:right-handed parallel beta-helix repeat-containing protein n=1 Tax=Streptomyces sp. NPDC087270 TaxID=3365774 RepID=UPI00380BE690
MPDRPLLTTALAALAATGGLVAAGGSAYATAADAARPAASSHAVSHAATVSVSTSDQLVAALAAAAPGDTIQLADGSYTGKFVATTAGTSSKPITLVGSAKAVLHSSEYTGPSAVATNARAASPTAARAASAATPASSCPTGGTGYGLYLDGAAYWHLTGFTVDTASKGIVMDAAPHVTIDGVEVRNIGDEGVHFRKGSSDGVIENSYVHDTGQNQPGYGEGVYIGSAKSNWACYAGSSGVDASDDVQVLKNRIGPNVAAEGLDIKEGTKNGVVSGNTFDGTGEQNENSADSTIDAKGDGYRIDGNKVSHPYLDGFQTHTAQSPYGCGNTFAGNTFSVTASDGYGINVTNNKKCADDDQNVVYDSNTSSGGKGLTDITVTPSS